MSSYIETMKKSSGTFRKHLEHCNSSRVSILEETLLKDFDSNNGGILHSLIIPDYTPLEEGKQYIVIFDGKEYDLPCYYDKEQDSLNVVCLDFVLSQGNYLFIGVNNPYYEGVTHTISIYENHSSDIFYVIHTDSNKNLVDSSFSNALEYLKKGKNVYVEYNEGKHLISYFSDVLMSAVSIETDSIIRYNITPDNKISKTTHAF